MGRRLSLMLVMMVLASPAIPVARGQTADSPGIPDTAPPGPTGAPLTIPGDFPALDDPVDPGAKPEAKAKADPKDPARTEGQEIRIGGEGQETRAGGEGQETRTGGEGQEIRADGETQTGTRQSSRPADESGRSRTDRADGGSPGRGGPDEGIHRDSGDPGRASGRIAGRASAARRGRHSHRWDEPIGRSRRDSRRVLPCRPPARPSRFAPARRPDAGVHRDSGEPGRATGRIAGRASAGSTRPSLAPMGRTNRLPPEYSRRVLPCRSPARPSLCPTGRRPRRPRPADPRVTPTPPSRPITSPWARSRSP